MKAKARLRQFKVATERVWMWRVRRVQALDE